MAEKVKAQLEKEAIEFKREEEIHSKGSVIETACEVPIWFKFPPLWDGHRKLEWTMLAKMLPKDENTFLVGPSRGMADSERAELERLGIHVVPILEEPVDNLMPCALLSLEKESDLDKSRFRLVPSKLTEPTFWRNFFWKCQELSKCTSSSQVESLLRVINCPVSKREIAEAAGREKCEQQAEKLRGLLEPLHKVEMGRIWLEEHTPSIEEGIRTAHESIQLLQEVLDRSVQGSAADDLMESLFNSCKYRKQKISAVIGDLSEHCPWQCEELQGKLMEMNDMLKEALKQYRFKFPLSSHGVISASSCSTDPKSLPATNLPEGGDDFDTKMPWDD
eukprot:GGOE01061542.1.p1 GENE.GGOE01061542.1~~GGOE01061542.1.p1  ORF type:complete len:366 (+),score=70.47 GGOE01061542.1:97-1098(+)